MKKSVCESECHDSAFTAAELDSVVRSGGKRVRRLEFTSLNRACGPLHPTLCSDGGLRNKLAGWTSCESPRMASVKKIGELKLHCW